MSSNFTKKPGSLAFSAFIAAAIITGSIAINARAQTARAPESNDALLNILVTKGILTDQEAASLRAEARQPTNASASVAQAAKSADGEAAPIQNPKSTIQNFLLTSLAFSGDVRMRYEYKHGSTTATATTPRDNFDMNRYRYRLRLGARGTLAGGWFLGARLETGNNNRSSNVTMGSYSAGTGFTGGKAPDNTIYLGQALVGWANKDLTFTAGRMANPFVHTQLFLWSDDLNVEGLAQQWKRDIGGLALFANLAELVYVSNGGMVNAFGSGGIPTTFMLGAQIGGRAKFPGARISLQIAPVFYAYSNDARHIAGMTPLAINPANPNSPNSPNLQTPGLRVLDIPLELNLPPLTLPPLVSKQIPAKIFGDLAINLAARTRARAAGFADKKNQNTAWQIGAALGQTKIKNDWELRAFYQSIGAYALDPNLFDLTQFDARANMRGWTAVAAYAFTTNVSVKLSYFTARRKDSALPTYGAANLNTARIGRYNCLQSDISIKF